MLNVGADHFTLISHGDRKQFTEMTETYRFGALLYTYSAPRARFVSAMWSTALRLSLTGGRSLVDGALWTKIKASVECVYSMIIPRDGLRLNYLKLAGVGDLLTNLISDCLTPYSLITLFTMPARSNGESKVLPLCPVSGYGHTDIFQSRNYITCTSKGRYHSVLHTYLHTYQPALPREPVVINQNAAFSKQEPELPRKL